MKIANAEALYLRLPIIENRTNSSQDALLVNIATRSPRMPASPAAAR